MHIFPGDSVKSLLNDLRQPLPLQGEAKQCAEKYELLQHRRTMDNLKRLFLPVGRRRQFCHQSQRNGQLI